MPVESAISGEARDAFAEALAEMGTPISFNGETRNCLTSPISNQLRQELGGFTDGIQPRAQIMMMKEDFWPNAIERQSEILLAGERLIFVNKIWHPEHPWVQFVLASQS